MISCRADLFTEFHKRQEPFIVEFDFKQTHRGLEFGGPLLGDDLGKVPENAWEICRNVENFVREFPQYIPGPDGTSSILRDTHFIDIYSNLRAKLSALPQCMGVSMRHDVETDHDTMIVEVQP